MSGNGGISLRTGSAGLQSSTERLAISNTGNISTYPAAGNHFVINENGVDSDFRVESDGNAHMISMDGGNNCVGIGGVPSRILEVQLTPVNASLHNTTGATAHFGGTGNTDGYIQGISLGYKSSGANTYIKTAIVARGRGDGAARQDLAFLVDTDADGGSAEIGNSVLTFDGLTGRGDFKKSAYISTFALTSASTVSWDAAAIANAYITLGHNVTIDQPSNPVHGAIISLEIKQPSSGGPYTVAVSYTHLTLPTNREV